MPSHDFLEAPAGLRRQFRQDDLGQEFRAIKIYRHGVEKEIARGNAARARSGNDAQRRIKQDCHHRQFCRRISMRQTTADGAAIADR
jgi:hypothetical protein